MNLLKRSGYTDRKVAISEAGFFEESGSSLATNSEFRLLVNKVKDILGSASIENLIALYQQTPDLHRQILPEDMSNLYNKILNGLVTAQDPLRFDRFVAKESRLTRNSTNYRGWDRYLNDLGYDLKQCYTSLYTIPCIKKYNSPYVKAVFIGDQSDTQLMVDMSGYKPGEPEYFQHYSENHPFSFLRVVETEELSQDMFAFRTTVFILDNNYDFYYDIPHNQKPPPRYDYKTTVKFRGILWIIKIKPGNYLTSLAQDIIYTRKLTINQDAKHQ